MKSKFSLTVGQSPGLGGEVVEWDQGRGEPERRTFLSGHALIQ
jgi:hypothetical protein